MTIQEHLALQAWILVGAVVVATVVILIAIVLDRRDRRRSR